ncbi:glycylpeptide N-tetradecanoyltransferase [Plectosphaerella cucumerina]|uniref:Glycylpeptide N-tetradecanoyltransferase n=1 Tax=Plectosphaerella cucumerina TaxID=40658 RepID=A0A8K0T9E0_9PEZI|nr:glycylpeptide N-tetradecanoyltransferase [Plectosphaerella cucumerina]
MAELNFPSAEETMKHPAYAGVIWKLEPTKKGILPCAIGRGGPIDIAWELHGTGPRRILLVMGLAGLATSWQRQTKHFAHDHGDEYSVLLIDNRGIGLSGSPLQRYSTSQMARDVLEVLDHVGWSDTPRSLHVCGISLGGMISQELALMVPDLIASLSLLCTAASMETTRNLPSVLWQRAGMIIPKPAEEAIRATALQIFTEEYLLAPDEAKDLPVPGVTPNCLPPPGADAYVRFDSNFQRFQAQELTKRGDKKLFTAKGFLLQLIAAGFHVKTPAQLRELGDKVGRERIAVVHGTRDNMIDVRFGRKLIEGLQPSVGMVVEGMGHAPVMENVDWFKKFFTERIELGEKLRTEASA